MIDGKRVLALIPARGGSKGLPRKNIRKLGGRPLVAWPVAAARGSKVVDRVVVSTDDVEIAAAAQAAGADTPFMRPSELASDTSSSMAVARHALETLARADERYDYLVLLEPTSPLTEPSDVDRALATLHSARNRADAIVGVAKVEATHPVFDVFMNHNGIITPYSGKSFTSLPRRQDIEELYYLEGSLYCSAVNVFLDRGSFYHERTLGYLVPRWKAFEIDDLVDFFCVEAIMAHRGELPKT